MQSMVYFSPDHAFKRMDAVVSTLERLCQFELPYQASSLIRLTRRQISMAISVLQSCNPPFLLKVAELGGATVGFSILGESRYQANTGTVE